MAAAAALMRSNPVIKEVTVQLGAGTFNVSAPVGVDDGVSLTGMGAGATILKALPVAGVELEFRPLRALLRPRSKPQPARA